MALLVAFEASVAPSGLLIAFTARAAIVWSSDGAGPDLRASPSHRQTRTVLTSGTLTPMDVVVAVLVIGFFAVPLAVCVLLVALGLWRLGREGPIDPHSTGADWLLERARVTTGRWGGHVAAWAGVGALVFGVGLFAFALPAVRG